MCGLVGIFNTRSRDEPDRGLLQRMNEAQFHRGPDEGGLHVEPAVGLGHRRLAIIDLAEGQQPLSNEDGSVIVVYNGEIYNFAELAEELKQAGHSFRTRSDTEVIVHAWEAWGEACVERFRGMFAFALWDRNRGCLFMARDRLGIKPFYYSLLGDGTLLFASELKALKVHPSLDRRIDHLACEEYFAFGYVPEPRTIYQQVRKLPPGHTLLWRQGQSNAEPRQYWDVPFEPAASMPEETAVAELVTLLREAVDIRLIAEVPLGAFLSGGVDSSSVVAMMAQLSEEPVNTCSIAFGEAAFDESVQAAEVAERYATRHSTEHVAADDFSLLDRLTQLYDEPFADSSALPTYRVCELARKRVTVALSGDGGDEDLAGYKRYGWQLEEQARRERVPALLRPLLGALGEIYPDMPRAPRILRARAALRSIGRDPVAGYMQIMSVMDEDLRSSLYSTGFKRELQGYSAVEVMRRHAQNCPTDDPLSLVQYIDYKTYLPGDILTKVDRASMAHALEVRVPLLDHKLVEWASRLPPGLKRKGGEGKYLLKKAMEPYLSSDILYRRKQGFAVPLADWFRGPLRTRLRDALQGESLSGSGLFDQAALMRLFDEHQSGARDRSAPLWSLLMFESFLRAEAA